MKTQEIQQHIDRYLFNKRAGGVTEGTLQSYDNVLSSFARFIKDNDKATIDEEAFSEHVNHLVSIGRKETTIQRCSSILRAFYAYLQDREVISVNMSHIKAFKAKPAERFTVRKEDVETMIAGIKGNSELALRNRAIILLLSGSGLRASEICSLNRDDFKINKNRYYEVSVRGKGSKVRVVPVTDDSAKALFAYFETRRDTNPAVFLSHGSNREAKSNKPLDRRTLLSVVSRIAHRAGYEGVGCHTLRHYACTEMLRSGLNVSIVQKIMGHSNLTTTQIYSHLVDADAGEAFHSVMG